MGPKLRIQFTHRQASRPLYMGILLQGSAPYGASAIETRGIDLGSRLSRYRLMLFATLLVARWPVRLSRDIIYEKNWIRFHEGDSYLCLVNILTAIHHWIAGTCCVIQCKTPPVRGMAFTSTCLTTLSGSRCWSSSSALRSRSSSPN